MTFPKIHAGAFKLNRRLLAIGTVLVFAALGFAALHLSGAQQLPTAQDDAVGTLAVTPNDPEYSKQTALAAIKVDQVWDRTKGNPTVIIANVASGIKSDHPDLQSKLVAGFDFVNNNSDPTPDSSGHGTATAGIMAAASNNGLGIAGVCWQCKIMPLDVLDETNAKAEVDWYVKAIDLAIERGAKVIHMPYTFKQRVPALADAVKRANQRGILVVAAVPLNKSDSSLTHYSPVNDPEALAVAAVDNADMLRSDSDYGSKVELAAPGASLMTTDSIEPIYGRWSGNYIASAVVAGIAALLYSHYPDATPAQMTQALVSTADPCCASKIAGGRVNALKAADYLEALYPTNPAPKAGDQNGDGKVNITDLSTLLSRWNSADVTADLNKDGKVGIADLSILLSNWTR